MKALMVHSPLRLDHLITRAERLFPDAQIVTRTTDGVHRTAYVELAERARRLAGALRKLGVEPGDRVATFAWNTFRHLELYFAVPMAGAVLHTLNIRLFEDQIAYIVNHAQDRVLFVDRSLLPLLSKLRERLSCVEHIITMGEGSPQVSDQGALDYETILAAASPAQPCAAEETDAAAMCYTSGTTGSPKGVLYSHRALVLQALVQAMADVFAISHKETVMPVVPMFHANAWALPYSATLVGAKQVFPASFLDPRSLVELIESERVTMAAGVPTVWNAVLELLRSEKHELGSLAKIICGGAAVPASMIEGFDRLGIEVVQAWGMTETSPLGTVGILKGHLGDLPYPQRLRLRAKQGLAAPTLDVRIVGEQGKEVPWDGESVGELQITGPWVASAYYRDERSWEAFDGTWLRTGDIATIDREGYVQIVDRAKDLIKSGGEWISSVELENSLLSHPKVLEAAVIAVPHPKWQERPLACVVPRSGGGQSLTKEELYEHLRHHFAKWWLPDDIVFVEELPKTSVGKVAKRVLRERFGGAARG